VATRDEIAQRYAEFEITAPAEVRHVEAEARYFNPESGPALNRASAQVAAAVKSSAADSALPVEEPIAIDDLERFLLLVFLRRYVTQCARSRQFAAMQGAAQLYASVSGR